MILETPPASAISTPNGCSDSPSASACAASRDSISARNSPCCAQAWSRNALRSLGSRSSAAPTISLIFGHCSGVSTGPPLHLPGQPRLGHIPISFDRGGRNTQHLRDLFSCEAPEKPQLDNAALLLVQPHQPVQRVVERYDIRAPHLRQDERGIELDDAFRTPLGGPGGRRAVHQYLPHQARGHGEKMCPVVSIKRTLVNQPQVSFVD